MLRRIACGAEAEAEADDDVEDDDDDGGGGGFLLRYREQRLRELQSQGANTSSSSSYSITSGRAPFSFEGALETAGTDAELLRLLDGARASSAPAVVLVHSPHDPGSRALHSHLAALAPRFLGARFVVAPASALPGVFDAAMLPVLIAYDTKGGAVESLPCADEALGKGAGHRLESGDVAWWLEGVLGTERRAE